MGYRPRHRADDISCTKRPAVFLALRLVLDISVDGWPFCADLFQGREVEKTAQLAQKYVETRLFKARLDYGKPLATRPGVEQLLIELDGCHIRTGKKVLIEGAELTKKRRLPRSQRPPDWREVRVGLARPLFAEGTTNLRCPNEQISRCCPATRERSD